MYIQDALKETGKIQHSNLEHIYAKEDEWGVLHWYSLNDTSPVLVKLSDILSDNWKPYPDKKEIRPEREGELWTSPNGTFWHTEEDGEGDLVLVGIGIGDGFPKAKKALQYADNFQCWTLLYSPDEEVMKELKSNS